MWIVLLISVNGVMYWCIICSKVIQLFDSYRRSSSRLRHSWSGSHHSSRTIQRHRYVHSQIGQNWKSRKKRYSISYPMWIFTEISQECASHCMHSINRVSWRTLREKSVLNSTELVLLNLNNSLRSVIFLTALNSLLCFEIFCFWKFLWDKFELPPHVYIVYWAD